MLAVSEGFRNHGLGRPAEVAQRDDAMAHGFELLEWTFDPLEIKNAYLNLVKLRGHYTTLQHNNHYGLSSSPLQGGLPTDRLVAEWWLKSKRVVNLLDQNQSPLFKVEKRIHVPAEIYSWKASNANRGKASEVQKRNREEFLSTFHDGLSVLSYERDDRGNGAFLLGRWDENLTYASGGDEGNHED